jgi:hypothetical protein
MPDVKIKVLANLSGEYVIKKNASDEYFKFANKIELDLIVDQETGEIKEVKEVKLPSKD